MSRKRILIVNPISLYPKVMASQDRVINMIKRLSVDHVVDLAAIIRDPKHQEETEQKIGKYINKFYPIHPINPADNKLRILIAGLSFLYHKYFHYITGDYFYTGHSKYIKQIAQIIKKNNYDIIQLEYWFQGDVFNSLNKNTIKVIDTQDVLYKKREQSYLITSGNKLSCFKLKTLKKYKQYELCAYQKADVIISITRNDFEILNATFPQTRNIIIATGQDTNYFNSYSVKQEEKTVLFYGSMVGQENIDAFFRFYNKILPLIEKKLDGITVTIVGANPPQSITSLASDRIIVTGFVEDVRSYIGKAKVMVIPLDVAGGFRSRTVEVLAMGIPVVGTHNALDNVEIEHGKHGYVSDDNDKMADYIIQILNNSELQKQMSDECKKFAAEKYSIENSFGKLSHYYSDL